MGLSERNEYLYAETRKKVVQVLRAGGAISQIRGGFCPSEQAPFFVEALHIPEKSILDILLTPHVSMFPDIPDFLRRIAECGSCSLLFTQGQLTRHVSEADWGRGMGGFQDIKADVSGITAEQLKYSGTNNRLHLPLAVGGFEKIVPDVLDDIFMRCASNNMHVAYYDDRLENLELMGEYARTRGFEDPMMYLVERYPQWISFGPIQNGIRRINTFDTVEVISDACHLLDLDRTALDTEGMKEDWVERITQAAIS